MTWEDRFHLSLLGPFKGLGYAAEGVSDIGAGAVNLLIVPAQQVVHGPLADCAALQGLRFVGDWGFKTPESTANISRAAGGEAINTIATAGAGKLASGLKVATPTRVSRGTLLRQKYGHYTPAQRQARIAELAEANRILREAGIPSKYVSEALQSFQPGTITSRVAGDADFGLRFFGGVSGPRSPYLSPTFPLGNVRQLSALPEGNTIESIIQYQIRPGTTILEGRVRPAFGQPGGGRQIYVPDFFNNLLPAN